MMSGGCKHVWGGWNRNTSPLLPTPASVLLCTPSKTSSPGGPSTPLPPSADEGVLL